MSNTSEKLIDTITKWFDDNNDLHLVDSLDKVYDVYVQVEEFVESLGLTLEHEVSESEFEDLPVTDLSNEDQLNEVKFVLPLMLGEEPHELVLEFHNEAEKFKKENPQMFQTQVASQLSPVEEVDMQLPEAKLTKLSKLGTI